MDYNAPPPQIAYCRICGKPLEPEAQRIAHGTVYCSEHAPISEPAATPWNGAPPPTGSRTGVDNSVSPGLAFLLGLLPGVGAIYNAQYAKGLVHVLVFGLLVTVASSDHSGELQVLFAILIPTWVIYQAFEAYHTARRRQMGEVVDEFSGFIAPIPGRRRSPMGPLLWIGLGVLFLLHNFELLRVSQVLKFWPLALIAVGVHRLYVRFQEPPVSQATSIPDEVRREQ